MSYGKPLDVAETPAVKATVAAQVFQIGKSDRIHQSKEEVIPIGDIYISPPCKNGGKNPTQTWREELIAATPDFNVYL